MLGHPVKDPSQSFHSVRAQPAELERQVDFVIWFLVLMRANIALLLILLIFFVYHLVWDLL